MARTLVNIISAQTIPNVLFIKEMYRDGDSLMFISSKKMESKIEWITNTLNIDNAPKTNVVFENNDDEERWDAMCNKVESFLTKDTKYLVNLTGGTKYMDFAVSEVFEKYDSTIYYIPHPKNYILSPRTYDNIPIATRLSVLEYLTAYNVPITHKELLLPEAYTNAFYDFYTSDRITDGHKIILDKLRAYRKGKGKNENHFEVAELENRDDTEKKPRIDGLSAFLTEINFPNKDNKLSKYEIQYLTGGWFEEYVYHLIKNNITPDDIQLGVEIQKTESTNTNDLDVVFTKGNKLYVIECKTGVGAESLFNQIVYKASALKENLLGLSGNSYIFSLNPPINDQLKNTAKNMGTTYIDLSDFLNREKLQFVFDLIITQSY
jgi:hypothetical protein